MTPAFASRLRIAARWLLGVLMLWAAVSKLASPTEFLGSIYSYRLPFPQAGLQVVAVLLPWVELLCGLALITNVWSEAVLALALGLFAVFVLATGQAWMRGLDISCGCFDLSLLGLSKTAAGALHFLESPAFAFFRAVLLAVLAGFLLRGGSRN